MKKIRQLVLAVLVGTAALKSSAMSVEQARDYVTKNGLEAVNFGAGACGVLYLLGDLAVAKIKGQESYINGLQDATGLRKVAILTAIGAALCGTAGGLSLAVKRSKQEKATLEEQGTEQENGNEEDDQEATQQQERSKRHFFPFRISSKKISEPNQEPKTPQEAQKQLDQAKKEEPKKRLCEIKKKNSEIETLETQAKTAEVERRGKDAQTLRKQAKKLEKTLLAQASELLQVIAIAECEDQNVIAELNHILNAENRKDALKQRLSTKTIFDSKANREIRLAQFNKLFSEQQPQEQPEAQA